VKKLKAGGIKTNVNDLSTRVTLRIGEKLIRQLRVSETSMWSIVTMQGESSTRVNQQEFVSLRGRTCPSAGSVAQVTSKQYNLRKWVVRGQGSR
jgi:hypothetical protein